MSFQQRKVFFRNFCLFSVFAVVILYFLKLEHNALKTRSASSVSTAREPFPRQLHFNATKNWRNNLPGRDKAPGTVPSTGEALSGRPEIRSKTEATSPSFGFSSGRGERLSGSKTVKPVPATGPWSEVGWCKQHLDVQYLQHVPVCPVVNASGERIQCYRNNLFNKDGVKCKFRDVVIFPDSSHAKPSLGLITDRQPACLQPNWEAVNHSTSSNGPFRQALVTAFSQVQADDSICKGWEYRTVFVFLGDQPQHIFFRVASYLNLLQAIKGEGLSEGDYAIVRLRHPSNMDYRYSDWEKKLFPRLQTLQEFAGGHATCLKHAVLVPFAFASMVFQCKMLANLRRECQKCSASSGGSWESLLELRRMVLSSCGVAEADACSRPNRTVRVGVILRKPYRRWHTETMKGFQRVLANEEELTGGVRAAVPDASVATARPEALHICEQVRFAAESDILLGVHGSGMVHLMWTGRHAVVVEMNPPNQLGNPTFRMLSSLVGRRYESVMARQRNQQLVEANVAGTARAVARWAATLKAEQARCPARR